MIYDAFDCRLVRATVLGYEITEDDDWCVFDRENGTVIVVFMAIIASYLHVRAIGSFSWIKNGRNLVVIVSGN